ncbi:hypothetical protein QT711_03175 [Sporosarcina saromensis]|uniref:Uncharacterized protein n=1 Tax=Sporosarcina saromensis TaxID=359365 RepID=A0ABU4G730_9BACL|nr:hypothetical protein [Sporosarcina saromensis]MDW0112172.1 hypothetical protein [Sporosarcina saromensis]
MDYHKQIEIHQYCDEMWQRLIDEKGLYTDDIDDVVLNSAAEKFNLTTNEVETIFHRIDRFMVALSGDFTAENIRKAIEKYKEENE